MSSTIIQYIKTEGLKSYLLQQLECPICFKYMSPPIRMCSKGHSTCDSCTKKFQTCTKCQYPFLTTRNLALEAISFEVEIKCPVCQKTFTSQIFYQHKCFMEETHFKGKENDNFQHPGNKGIVPITTNG